MMIKWVRLNFCKNDESEGPEQPKLILHPTKPSIQKAERPLLLLFYSLASFRLFRGKG